MFTLEAESHKTFTILRLTGEVLLPDVTTFTEQLEAYFCTPNIRQVVLDLSQIQKMDNSGLGVLVSVSTKSLAQGRRLVLLAPAPHIVDLFRATQIEGFFPTIDSIEELKPYSSEVTE